MEKKVPWLSLLEVPDGLTEPVELATAEGVTRKELMRIEQSVWQS